MSLRAGTYIVPTHRWYIERTVLLIAVFALLTSTALALLVDPLWILGVTTTGLVSINVALTGFCASTFCKSIAGISSAASTRAIHAFRLRRHGLVRGDRLLHHGQRALLAWRRTSAQSGRHAVRPL